MSAMKTVKFEKEQIEWQFTCRNLQDEISVNVFLFKGNKY